MCFVLIKQSDFRKSSSYLEEQSIGCLDMKNFPLLISGFMLKACFPHRNQ